MSNWENDNRYFESFDYRHCKPDFIIKRSTSSVSLVMFIFQKVKVTDRCIACILSILNIRLSRELGKFLSGSPFIEEGYE